MTRTESYQMAIEKQDSKGGNREALDRIVPLCLSAGPADLLKVVGRFVCPWGATLAGDVSSWWCHTC
jgi:hypothetical protein